MNPFRKLAERFAEKTPRQRVLAVIGFLLIAMFAFFFIKAIFFEDTRQQTQTDPNTSYTDSGSSADAEDGSETAAEHPTFHLSSLDVILVIVIVVLVLARLIIKKLSNRRM